MCVVQERDHRWCYLLPSPVCLALLKCLIRDAVMKFRLPDMACRSKTWTTGELALLAQTNVHACSAPDPYRTAFRACCCCFTTATDGMGCSYTCTLVYTILHYSKAHVTLIGYSPFIWHLVVHPYERHGRSICNGCASY